MPAKRIYQVKLPTKAGGQRGYVSVCRLNVRGSLFIFSLKFQKQGTISEAPWLQCPLGGALPASGPASGPIPLPLL